MSKVSHAFVCVCRPGRVGWRATPVLLQGAMSRHHEALQGLQASRRDVDSQIAKHNRDQLHATSIHAKWVALGCALSQFKGIPRAVALKTCYQVRESTRRSTLDFAVTLAHPYLILPSI